MESAKGFTAIDFLRIKSLLANENQTSTEDVPLDVVVHLKDALEEVSFALQKTDPSGRLIPAENWPGYVATDCDHWRVFVPWPLIPSFPGDEVLVDLLSLGMRIGVPPVNALCISGSSATLGSPVAIGDIDFCQYVLLSPAEIVEIAVTFKVPEHDRILVAARYGNQDPVVATAPWDQKWPPLQAKMSEDTVVDNAERFMTEFVSFVDRFGHIPVSNVVLASDPADRRRGAAAQSFVFQEAIAVRDENGPSSPLWSLVDPLQLAWYLRLLEKHILWYRDQNPIKALKRALSFARTIRLHTRADEILDILSSPETASYVAVKRARDLAAQVEQFGEAEVAVYCGSGNGLVTTPQVSAGAHGQVEAINDKAASLLGRLLLDVQQLEAQLGVQRKTLQ